MLKSHQEQLDWARARKLATYSFRLPVMYLVCPDEARNKHDDFLDDPQRLKQPYQEVVVHAFNRWCGDCMDGCHCPDIAEALGGDDYGHDEDMSCVWCRVHGRAPYEARLSGAMLGEGVDL